MIRVGDAVVVDKAYSIETTVTRTTGSSLPTLMNTSRPPISTHALLSTGCREITRPRWPAISSTMLRLFVSIDWKEAVPKYELRTAKNLVGGPGWVTEWFTTGVDVRFWFVASRALSPDEMRGIWEAGDLYTIENVWEGTVPEIREKLTAYAAEREKEGA